jgi:hypothetical protein
MEHADVIAQVIQRGVQAAGLRRRQRPRADGVALGSDAGLFAGVAVLEQTLDDDSGEQAASQSFCVGELLFQRGAQGIELQVGVREGFRFGFVANRWACTCRMIYGGHDQLSISWFGLAGRGSVNSHDLRLPHIAAWVIGAGWLAGAPMTTAT